MSNGARRDTLLRYDADVRTNHWLVALSFVLAALSGLALFHPALFWLSNLFGGGPWTRILHPFIGLFMVLVFLGLAARVWDENRFAAADWQWLRQWREVINNQEERLPEVGRYNGGQKLVFFVLVACLLVLFATGLLMWRAYFTLPVGAVRIAALLHAIAALLIICTILVHIYAGFWVRGSMHAMLRGTVTPGWAWRHHRAWFRQITHASNPRARPD
ncbi:MAG: formate dehydrogenase subunit gamma [Gammaproteobacteria bacterium]|nr:formate dehydrogenase subunit gamma [Gammaproteobacteria bacterium]MBV8404520.1 formate dehydrogenase subunit gamma [Gammaproteobacteria bacterium]